MKKFIFVLMAFALIFVGTVGVCAEEASVDADSKITEQILTETQTTSEETAPVETAPEETKSTDEYAKTFVDYIFSGGAGSEELMDKIIAMGEQYQASKEAGYTFEERIAQMITTENITTLAAAGFLVICGIAFFVIEQKQKKDRHKIYSYVSELEQKYSAEIESNTKLKDDIEKQRESIEEMKAILTALRDNSINSKDDMNKVAHANVAVAKMVKDVFLNSKTLDASAKALMVHNYMEVVESETDKKENEK